MAETHKGADIGGFRSPCLGCAERHETCHAACPRYRTFAEARERVRDELHEARKAREIAFRNWHERHERWIVSHKNWHSK